MSSRSTEFIQLRVVQKSTAKDAPDTHHLYGGISVNSWFRPFGVEQRTTNHSPVSIDIQQELSKRAKSSNAILGRRHFQIKQQGLSSNDIIKGIPALASKLDRKDYPFNTKVKKIPIEKAEKLVTFCMPEPVPQERTNLSNPLMIRQYNSFKDNSEVREHKRESVEPEIDTQSIFKSEYDIHKAYSRMKSAPSGKRQSLYHPNIDLLRPKSADRDRKQTPCSPRNRFDLDVTRTPPRSTLRPLLYNLETAGNHGMVCSHQCKGCFKACLVSEDLAMKCKGQESDKKQLEPTAKRTAQNMVIKPKIKIVKHP